MKWPRPNVLKTSPSTSVPQVGNSAFLAEGQNDVVSPMGTHLSTTENVHSLPRKSLGKTASLRKNGHQHTTERAARQLEEMASLIWSRMDWMTSFPDDEEETAGKKREAKIEKAVEEQAESSSSSSTDGEARRLRDEVAGWDKEEATLANVQLQRRGTKPISLGDNFDTMPALYFELMRRRDLFSHHAKYRPKIYHLTPNVDEFWENSVLELYPRTMRMKKRVKDPLPPDLMLRIAPILGKFGKYRPDGIYGFRPDREHEAVGRRQKVHSMFDNYDPIANAQL